MSLRRTAQGNFRIAHCGGYHGNLDVLINALNVVAKLLGHPIHWDTGAATLLSQQAL